MTETAEVEAVERLRERLLSMRERITDEQYRSMRGAFGAFVQHQQHDPHETTARARETFGQRFARAVDPDGWLRLHEPLEFERQVAAAKRAYYRELAFKSVKSRQERAWKRVVERAASGVAA